MFSESRLEFECTPLDVSLFEQVRSGGEPPDTSESECEGISSAGMPESVRCRLFDKSYDKIIIFG